MKLLTIMEPLYVPWPLCGTGELGENHHTVALLLACNVLI